MLKIVIDEFVDKLINHVIIVFLSIKQVSDNWFSTKRKVENSLRTLIEHLVFVVKVLL
jgi:UTP-glucose-1-phosphate uridylyltransferase